MGAVPGARQGGGACPGCRSRAHARTERRGRRAAPPTVQATVPAIALEAALPAAAREEGARVDRMAGASGAPVRELEEPLAPAALQEQAGAAESEVRVRQERAGTHDPPGRS